MQSWHVLPPDSSGWLLCHCLCIPELPGDMMVAVDQLGFPGNELAGRCMCLPMAPGRKAGPLHVPANQSSLINFSVSKKLCLGRLVSVGPVCFQIYPEVHYMVAKVIFCGGSF